jgi:hypothetical protein
MDIRKLMLLLPLQLLAQAQAANEGFIYHREFTGVNFGIYGIATDDQDDSIYFFGDTQSS